MPAVLALGPVGLAQLLADGAGTIVVEDATVEAAHPDRAAGGRGDEDLVGVAQLLDGHVPNLAGQSELGAELDDGEARDAAENVAVWRYDDALGDAEDVVARPFRDVAGG